MIRYIYTEFLTLFWFAMLINEYRLEIQFKKVRKVRNINNIPMVGSDHWNVGLRRTDFIWSLTMWESEIVQFYIQKSM